MKDIKTKELDRSPKIRNPVSRMPKEFVRTAALKAKEKPRQITEAPGTDTIQQESPTEFGSEKVTDAEAWAGRRASSTVLIGGQKLAKKSQKKIREKKQEQAFAKEAQAARETQRSTEANGTAAESPLKTGSNTSAGERMKAQTKQALEEHRGIKVRNKQKEFIRTGDRKTIKTEPRIVKSSPIPAQKVKTNQMSAQIKHSKQAMRAAKQAAVRSAKATKISAKTTKTVAKGVVTAVKGTVTAVQSQIAAIVAGGWIVVLIIISAGVIGGVLFSSSSQSSEPLSQEVQSYTPTLQKYATQYGIPEYVASLQAIMMQESGGRGTDPMQSSECPYNTRFSHSPGAITDPEYSIQVGVQYYADCVKEAECRSPQDIGRLQLSWQGYNYGNGYIAWAIQKFGGYSAANALQFSQEQAASHGWARYGDPEYVPHVQRYYSSGNIFAGLFGNEEIVRIAKAQIGNEGGKKFWSWYGFAEREEWCACFVSWCADQCGLIKSGLVPRFALCENGMNWFQNKYQWRGSGYSPMPGDFIFFDWPKEGVRDGVSDHVGIVEKCENGIVYTIEGNSGDKCKQNSYPVGYDSILGYGVPAL